MSEAPASALFCCWRCLMSSSRSCSTVWNCCSPRCSFITRPKIMPSERTSRRRGASLISAFLAVSSASRAVWLSHFHKGCVGAMVVLIQNGLKLPGREMPHMLRQYIGRQKQQVALQIFRLSIQQLDVSTKVNLSRKGDPVQGMYLTTSSFQSARVGRMPTRQPAGRRRYLLKREKSGIIPEMKK